MSQARDAALTIDANRRIGVIDIGSNSIRLVVYDRLSRAPLPIINRKAVLGLGTDVERHGKLSDESFTAAVRAIHALTKMAQDVPVADLALLATAGVRSAKNGEAFCKAIREKTGYDVTVLSGEDEAELSALGVVSALPDLTGVVGDLGGGSLELVALKDGKAVARASLDIGPLRLIERTRSKLAAASALIDDAISSVNWLPEWRGRNFYAVGGAWRAIAKVHRAQHDYPLRVVHGYQMSQREARDFTELLEHLGAASVSGIRVISSKRSQTLPWGAIALDRVVAALEPKSVVFSAHGLREGHHFQALDSMTQAEDPLFSACHELAGQHRRFPDASEALEKWIAPVTERLSEADDRLVHAACILGDIGWSEHPEYRSEQALYRVLHMPWSVMDHGQRAFLALVMFVRYGGSAGSKEANICRRLLRDDEAQAAKALGKALRLAFKLCAGRGSVLATTPLSQDSKNLVLELGPDAMIASPEKVARYAASLGRAMACKVTVVDTANA
jgi:exopolyphosphatase/guanosine-5'-triphosphate,3'-diphosphate pyrophosphatase